MDESLDFLISSQWIIINSEALLRNHIRGYNNKFSFLVNDDHAFEFNFMDKIC